MKKTEFLEKVTNSSRDELDKILHERCKPIKKITIAFRTRKVKEEK